MRKRDYTPGRPTRGYLC